MSNNQVGPVVALCKINGNKHPAKSIFVPATEAERKELFALGAVRELTDAERNLFEDMNRGRKTDKPQLDHDGDGKAGGSKPGRRKAKAETSEAPAAPTVTEGEGSEGEGSEGEGAEVEGSGEGEGSEGEGSEGEGSAETPADDAEAAIG